MSAAHKAAISAGLKRYWASKRSAAPKTTPIQNISTGKTISREDAARIMFGSAGSRKKKATGRKVRR